ncbi:MAG: twin-arginine translocation signal domain-containing protein [Patescibacteria group bacterium]
MQEQESSSLLKKSMNRRDFLRYAGMTGAALLLAASAPKEKGFALRELPIAPNNLKNPEPFPDKVLKLSYENLPSVEAWDSKRLKSEINKAIKTSIETNQKVEILLPHGEILIDETVRCVVPTGADIVLKGHTEGTKIKLSSTLAEIPTEWGSFGNHNCLFFHDIAGKVKVSSICFDGGSNKAKEEKGYKAPPSPWDAVVMAVGAGDLGSSTEADVSEANNRKGEFVAENCEIAYSESSGFLSQNLRNADFRNINASNLDAAIVGTWCDEVKVANITGEKFLSDGIYLNACESAQVVGSRIKTARQGYDIQGVNTCAIIDSSAYDCFRGFELTGSESIKEHHSVTIGIERCQTDECFTPYSIGDVRDLRVFDCTNTNLGAWSNEYSPGDFYHYDGIVRPEDRGYTLDKVSTAILDYSGDRTNSRSFAKVKMVTSPQTPPEYRLPKYRGIEYFRSQ